MKKLILIAIPLLVLSLIYFLYLFFSGCNFSNYSLSEWEKDYDLCKSLPSILKSQLDEKREVCTNFGIKYKDPAFCDFTGCSKDVILERDKCSINDELIWVKDDVIGEIYNNIFAEVTLFQLDFTKIDLSGYWKHDEYKDGKFVYTWKSRIDYYDPIKKSGSICLSLPCYCEYDFNLDLENKLMYVKDAYCKGFISPGGIKEFQIVNSTTFIIDGRVYTKI